MNPRVFDTAADNLAQSSEYFFIDACIFYAVFSHFHTFYNESPQQLLSADTAAEDLTRHFHHLICLYLVKFCNIVKTFKYESAFKAGLNFFYIIFKPL